MPAQFKILETWWSALIHPEESGQLVLGIDLPDGFDRFLLIFTFLLYSFYGISMGMYRTLGGPATGVDENLLFFIPSLVSAIKLPMLYGFTFSICLPALYHLNCLLGPKLSFRQCIRLLMIATSANAAALASYGPFSFFFVFTTSTAGYNFLVLMHVVVFAAAGIASMIVISIIFRATAKSMGLKLSPIFLAGWSILYGFVGMQMSWALRPWIGDRAIPFTVLRSMEGSFYESVWNLLTN